MMTSPATKSEPGLESALIRWGLWLVLVLGVAFRLVAYRGRPSLRADEAFVALNVLERGYLDLLRPLDWLQVAPPGFLWIERTAYLLFGSGEAALRLAPLLAGMTLLFLMAPVARRLVHPSAALPVVASVAFMQVLVQYSNEVKPYIFDALASAVVCFLTLRVIERNEAQGKLRIALAALPFVALPSSFVGVGAVGALACGNGCLRIDRSWWWTAGIWTLACAAAVMLSSDAATRAEMQQYWGGAFLIDPASSAGYLLKQLHLFAKVSLADLPMGRELLVLLFLAVSLLGLSTIRQVAGGQGVALVALPFLAALVAALLRQYPLAWRLWLWSFPYLALLTVAAAYRLTRVRTTHAVAMSIALTGLILVTRGWEVVRFARNPYLIEHARPVIEELEERAMPGDAIYLFSRSTPSWLYYTTDWEDPPANLDELYALGRPGGPIYVNAWEMAPVSENELRILASEDAEGRPLLFGRSSGFRIHHVGVPARQHLLSPSWGPSEVTRIRSRSRSGCAWLFASHVVWPEWRAFREAVEQTGGRLRDSIEGVGARAVRICFPAGTDVRR